MEDDFGSIGRAWRETESASADRATTLNDLYSGQFNDPVRVVAFNTREGWSRDVSAELAAELLHCDDLEGRQLEGALAEFVQAYTRPPPAVASAGLRSGAPDSTMNFGIR